MAADASFGVGGEDGDGSGEAAGGDTGDADGSGDGQAVATCGDVKVEYRANDCCGNPNKIFHWSKVRRMAERTEDEWLLKRDASALESASGSKRAELLQTLKEIAGVGPQE